MKIISKTMCVPTLGDGACVTMRWLIDPIDANNQEICSTVTGTFEFLNCGEAAFGAVYQAIAQAKQSVSIINLGFQPSMYFVRKHAVPFAELMAAKRAGRPIHYSEGRALPIGELLIQKAAEGVKVRILAWTFDIASINLLGHFTPDSPEPGRGRLRIGDRPFIYTDEQYDYDRAWYDAFDRVVSGPDEALKLPTYIVGNGLTGKMLAQHLDCEHRNCGAHEALLETFHFRKARANLHFRTRGYTLKSRAQSLYKGFSHRYIDPTVSKTAAFAMGFFASHHQKSVLVDYADPEHHVGFIMGHNMLDEYWDTEAHSGLRHAPHEGRNGDVPRQDVSSRLTGPLIKGVLLNFKEAWEKAGGDTLETPDFRYYQRDPNAANVFGQVLRTQRDEKESDIARIYFRTICYASQCIYIENQYFRWPPFAEAIVKQADRLFGNGRELTNPKHGGALHLFVITNTSADGLEDGTVKTLEMLDKLGRSDTLPNVARTNVESDLARNDEEMGKLKKAQEAIEAQQKKDQIDNRFGAVSGKDPALKARWDKLQADLEREQARQPLLEQRQRELAALKAAKDKDPNTPVLPKARPGLKVLICALVPMDTPAAEPGISLAVKAELEKVQRNLDLNSLTLSISWPQPESLLWRKLELERQQKELQALYDKRGSATYSREQEIKDGIPRTVWRWPETYVHSKLMILDDCLLTLGSANLNTRSMENDSEMNVVHHIPEVTGPIRQKLWTQHTNGMGAQKEYAVAFEQWGKLMKENRKLEVNGRPPKAPLKGFLYLGNVISNKD